MAGNMDWLKYTFATVNADATAIRLIANPLS